MSEKNGGPAFPQCSYNLKGGYDTTGGMTLRDYFAAGMVPTIYKSAIEEAAKGSNLFSDDQWRVGLALDAYAMADAMLKAREQ